MLFSLRRAVVSDLTLRVSQDSGYLQTLGGLGSPSAPLPVLLFPLCCRACGLTLEEADLEGDKAEGEGEADGGQVQILQYPEVKLDMNFVMKIFQTNVAVVI